MMAVIEMFNYANGVWEARRAEPTDDLASLIAHATIDGDELDVIDFNLFFLLLIDAGGDTTRNLVAGGIDALFAHPDQLAWLTEDLDARLAPAVEELLRWVSPVVYMRRTAQRDTELRGVPIAAGQKVVMYYGVGQPRPGGVRADGRACSTSLARPTTTSRSAAAARTSAWAPTSRGWRSTRCSASC